MCRALCTCRLDTIEILVLMSDALFRCHAGLEAAAGAEEASQLPAQRSQPRPRQPPLPPQLRLPKSDASPSTRAAAPFPIRPLADSDPQLWLLQHGEAARLVAVQNPGGSALPLCWRLAAATDSAPAQGCAQPAAASAAPGAQQRPANPAAACAALGAAAPVPTEAPAADIVGDSSGGGGGGGGGGGAPGCRGGALECRWRVRLRDCVDAAAAVVATPAALAGDAAGEYCLLMCLQPLKQACARLQGCCMTEPQLMPSQRSNCNDAGPSCCGLLDV